MSDRQQEGGREVPIDIIATINALGRSVLAEPTDGKDPRDLELWWAYLDGYLEALCELGDVILGRDSCSMSPCEPTTTAFSG